MSQSKSLWQQLDDEARQLAGEAFGPNATAEQIERVNECEWAMFTFHAATGDDLDCFCGAHFVRVDTPPPAVAYKPEDFG